MICQYICTLTKKEVVGRSKSHTVPAGSGLEYEKKCNLQKLFASKAKFNNHFSFLVYMH